MTNIIGLKSIYNLEINNARREILCSCKKISTKWIPLHNLILYRYLDMLLHLKKGIREPNRPEPDDF